MKFNKIILCLFVLGVAIPACAQMGGERQTSEITVKGKTLSINYGSPNLNGRDVFSLAPVGTVWRLGKNQATEITTTGDLTVAGKTLKAGKYSLWAKKTGANAWVLAFHPKTGVWGQPELKEGYVAELPLKVEKVGDAAEQLNISLVDMKGKAGIKIHWGTAVLSGAFDVN
jgi:Protein of unknown function (DUF2911)